MTGVSREQSRVRNHVEDKVCAVLTLFSPFSPLIPPPGSPPSSPYRCSSISSSSSLRSSSSEAGILPASPDIHFDSYASRSTPIPSHSSASGSPASKPEVGGATKLKTVSWRTHDAAAREFDAGAMGHAFERKDVAKVDTGVKQGEKVKETSLTEFRHQMRSGLRHSFILPMLFCSNSAHLSEIQLVCSRI